MKERLAARSEQPESQSPENLVAKKAGQLSRSGARILRTAWPVDRVASRPVSTSRLFPVPDGASFSEYRLQPLLLPDRFEYYGGAERFKFPYLASGEETLLEFWREPPPLLLPSGEDLGRTHRAGVGRSRSADTSVMASSARKKRGRIAR
jgi:hypothetical protein